MGKFQRIKTELGINKTINVNLEQEFDFLEILSLKIQQSEVYTRSCSDYGTIVGRVSANSGYGLPNAKISIFVPIQNEDLDNPLITSIYPYKSPSDKNEDGYRYNLLPHEQSYSNHTPTGTFPSRKDALTNSTAIEVYDKYYKYTVKTNDSGDYMIMGVPTGPHIIFMDLDLSDMGEFSLSPQDIIRMGRGTEAQMDGVRFKSSSNLNSLPQIVSIQKDVDVKPLWGEPSICQIAINRIDFDLRDDLNIEINPTATFMGSIFSTEDKYRVKGPVYAPGNILVSSGTKPKDDMGNLCSLTTGPGQILAIRQTIFQGSNGNPILEEYKIEENGNIIDGNGAWMTELPMNLDYVITNEFGEKVLSKNPKVGIPTKSKYRFKVKWKQPKTLTEQVRRPHFLIPNIKEYGWVSSGSDPYNSTNPQIKQELSGSYYFGLDWSGYTNPTAAINCEDTFYEFNYNRVYTVSSFIDEFKNGSGRGRFIGVKEIDDRTCESTVNKFPVNDGFRNFDLLFFIVSFLFQIIQLFGTPIVIILHIVAFLWNNFAVPILVFLIGFLVKLSIDFGISAAVAYPAVGLIVKFAIQSVAYLVLSIILTAKFRDIVSKKFNRINLAMITYPDCNTCECQTDGLSDGLGSVPSSIMTQVSSNALYYTKLQNYVQNEFGLDPNDQDGADTIPISAIQFSQCIGGDNSDNTDIHKYKVTWSKKIIWPTSGKSYRFFSSALPIGERVNLFNSKIEYFKNNNIIKVSFDSNVNVGKSHYDNTLTVLLNQKLESGTLLTFVDLEKSKDPNYLFSGQTSSGITNGISGTSLHLPNTTVDINYANPNSQFSNLTQRYLLTSGSTIENYIYPLDIEYYQVVTAITVTQAKQFWNQSDGFPSVIMGETVISGGKRRYPRTGYELDNHYLRPADYFENFDNQYITIIQRGVDPYSPIYENEYGLGRIFGKPNYDDVKIKAKTRINVPVQKILSNSSSVSQTSQLNNFYTSKFFQPGNQFSAFTSSIVGYYGTLDAQHLNNELTTTNYYSNILISKNTNDFRVNQVATPYYYDQRDISGAGFYWEHMDLGRGFSIIQYIIPATFLYGPTGSYVAFSYSDTYYTSPTNVDYFNSNPMPVTNKNFNIMRVDRLPSSDYLDGVSWSQQACLLQQNLGFAAYSVTTGGGLAQTTSFGSGADTVSPDIEGQIAATNVLSTLGDCASMVSLTCYSGNGTNFGVDTNCSSTDSIQNGCYVLVEKPFVTLGKDIKSFAQWGYRFRFFYGLCRGVLSQSFVNNWINGSLYMFPIQVDTFYDNKNKPKPPIFPKKLVYFDDKTNNFYYRSSPYITGGTNYFVGFPSSSLTKAVNKRNILFPTTIMNLGMKGSFYDEIIFDPATSGYVVNELNPTSYSDTSDLVNLFVISRIANQNFMNLLAGLNSNSNLNQLFSRPEKRIDGDLAQSMSINSEFGVIPFSPEYYYATGNIGDPVEILGSVNNPTMGIFFSSTTDNLQYKDFLTPGIIDFRPNPTTNAITFYYGIKSQEIPLYQWGLNNGSSIFGDEKNDWRTDISDIVPQKYQSLDRRNRVTPTYFVGTNSLLNDIYERGYIFNVDTTGNYSNNSGTFPSQFIVGAPFHFYFGLIKGQTALDKFKTKYSLDV
jgi:hypothetical protein